MNFVRVAYHFWLRLSIFAPEARYVHIGLPIYALIARHFQLESEIFASVELVIFTLTLRPLTFRYLKFDFLDQ